jgi:hypothetical protein
MHLGQCQLQCLEKFRIEGISRLRPIEGEDEYRRAVLCQ